MMNCDRIAVVYRWLEYLVFGRSLEQCRNYFLGALADRRYALVLGDGDGRFLLSYLRANEHGRVDYVDISEGMLQLAQKRVALLSSGIERVRLLHGDGREIQDFSNYDLIATHFFLDCLAEQDIDALAGRIQETVRGQVAWVVSEFRIPDGIVMRPVGATLIRTMYLCFRLATGLEARVLPNHREILLRHGFRLRTARHRLRGLLVSELWDWGPQSGS